MSRMLYFAALLAVLVACNDHDQVPDINNPKVKAAYEARKQAFIHENMKNCREDILYKAGIYVDSVVAAEIDYRINDSIIFPEKPIKPEWPGDIVVPDSIKAIPLFRK